MKLYSNKRALWFTILLVIMVGIFLLWWRNGRDRFMNADITSSNGSKYSISVLKSMQAASFMDYDSLKYQPSLEFEDGYRDLHIMIIDDSKAKIISYGLDYDLDTYMKIASRQIDSGGVRLNKSIEINGNKALQTDIQGKTNGKPTKYRLTCVETPKYFYQILIWSSVDKFEQNAGDIGVIVSSFKEQ